jgi:hypothetical protein
MIDSKKKPDCFGRLETVFPKKEDGLRHTPENCMACEYKTPCLKAAMNGARGINVREEMVNRSYEAGLIGFWRRWSQKKTLNREKRQSKGEKQKMGGGCPKD